MEIFVFGSNLAGRHGAGAARDAFNLHGAVYGQGSGPQGRSYAIPTKDAQLRPLPLPAIREYVHAFVDHARRHPDATFRVTRIGCGLAGYQDSDIAPFFRDAPPNCLLPEGWRMQTEIVLRDPKIVISVEKVIKGDGADRGLIETAQYQLEVQDIPRHYMDDIAALVGNGLARVTVSADFGIKEYGTGASAMASVSLTCNQDAATIDRAAKLAGDMARDIGQEQRQRAENELQALIAQRQSGAGPSY